MHQYHTPIPPIKGRLPFRIGSTSYVFPDHILPNVQALATVVDDIELVLFESSDASNLPDAGTIHHLRKLAGDHDLSYTVHLPIDAKAGAPDPEERACFVHQSQRIISLTLPLEPAAYILHLEGIDPRATPEAVEQWRGRVSEVCFGILESGVDPARFAVENLGYPVDWHRSIVEGFGFSYCLDIGHLWRYRADWKSVLSHYLPSTRVIHLHGESDGKDHISLRDNEFRVAEVLAKLVEYRGVLTLELFSPEDFFPSLEIIGRLWHTP